MADKIKIPFNSQRHDIKLGGKFEVNAKKSSLVVTTPIVPPWVDDGSWSEYKSNGSVGDITKKSGPESSRERRASSVSPSPEKKVLLKPVVFPTLNRDDSGNKDQQPQVPQDQFVQPIKKKLPRKHSITSGLMHNLSVSTLGTSMFEPMQLSPPGSPPRSSPKPLLTGQVKYTTFMFNNGEVETKSSLQHSEVKTDADLGPVGEFYLPRKLTKSIVLPSISRSQLLGGSMSFTADHAEIRENPTEVAINDELEEDSPGESPNEGMETDHEIIPTTEDPLAVIPPVQPVPYQIHNRVLGSKLLPTSGSRRLLSPPKTAVQHLNSTLPSRNTTSDGTVPFQVHKRVMGWKLTSINRRKELIALLDIVNSKDENGQKLKQELQRQGILSDFPDTLNDSQRNIHSADEYASRKRAAKRMAASWESAVSRISKARDKTPFAAKV